jgi:GrpB-like predicted nucleotidyltransferase (UPF0157 family)
MRRQIEPVVVVDYDPEWPRDFERLRARAAAALGDMALSIEHVGSTAVPGMVAKPVIDLDVIVRSSLDVSIAIERLRSVGYEHEGDLGVLGREAFQWPAGEPRHHLYVCAADSDALRNHLLFRDYLRSHPDAAERYGDVKRKAAREFGDDRQGYFEAKRAVGEEILDAAQQEWGSIGPVLDLS